MDDAPEDVLMDNLEQFKQAVLVAEEKLVTLGRHL